MRIAFVGKGGSGKTTLTALYTDYISKKVESNIMLVDADMNIHVGDLLGFPSLGKKMHLSSPDMQVSIKEYIKGKNSRIESIGHIKKTTPPTERSGFIDLSDEKNIIFSHASVRRGNVFLSAVGTYEEEGIGKSCYHNNLSILENVLSHSIDIDEVVISDMVAGIDAFAGSLHSQFDLLVLSVEPTIRSVSVFEKYAELAKSAGVFDDLYVVGNKVADQEDKDFITEHISQDKIIGFIPVEEHIRRVDKGRGVIDSGEISQEGQNTLSSIHDVLGEHQKSFNQRLARLHSLHRTYVSQGYVVDRFGDLTGQIQEEFDLDKFVKECYEKR